MNEYKVTFGTIINGLFTTRVETMVDIFQAENTEKLSEAIKQAIKKSSHPDRFFVKNIEKF